MAETNTEKPTAKEEKPSEKSKGKVKSTSQSKKQSSPQNQANQPQNQQKKTSEKKTIDEKSQTKEKTEPEETEKKTTGKQTQEDKKTQKQKKQSKPKKSEAKVNVRDLPLSTKISAAICKFVKNKEIKKAVEELNQVIEKKKPLPMKGKYPHQKGIMSGKYPEKAAKEFRSLLRSLGANAVENGLEKPIVKVAIANKGQRPMAKFGMWERKRTHVTLIAKDSAGQNNKGKKIKSQNKNK